MASNDVDASEDVNDFLLRIRELGEKRDKEDEERTKKLEQEILQGRKEREARRAGTDFPVFVVVIVVITFFLLLPLSWSTEHFVIAFFILIFRMTEADSICVVLQSELDPSPRPKTLLC